MFHFTDSHICEVLDQLLTEQDMYLRNLIKKLVAIDQGDACTKIKGLLDANKLAKITLAKYPQRDKFNHYFELAHLPQPNLNPDLGEDIVEVVVVRGLAYPNPLHGGSHLDTYVEVEFQVGSSDLMQKLTTSTVKNSLEPIYEQANKHFKVNTKSNVYRRFVQNNRSIKAHVYYNRGYFKSAGLLGTVDIPLSNFLQLATTNYIGDLKESRKSVGGRLEVQLRQRSSNQGEAVIYEHKPWLIVVPLKKSEPSHSNISKNITNSRTNPSRDASPKPFRSIAILKFNQHHYEQSLEKASDPNQRLELESKLHDTHQVLSGLEQQLNNDSKNLQFRNQYLEQLKHQFFEYQQKYAQADQQSDSNRMQTYRSVLNLIGEEIKHFA